MIRNPNYTGNAVYNRRAPKNKKRRYNDESEWLTVKNTHEAIISIEVFEKAKEILASKTLHRADKNIDHNRSSYSLLAGKVRCQHCGNIYVAISTKLKSGNGRLYYYECSGHRKYGKSICPQHLIPQEYFDAFILYRIQGILTQEIYVKAFRNQMLKTLEKFNDEKKKVDNIHKKVSKLISKKDRLMNLITEQENIIIIKTYNEKICEIVLEIEKYNIILQNYKGIEVTDLKEALDIDFSEISVAKFAELDKVQLKKIFNELIDYISIKEIDSVTLKKGYAACIEIHSKINSEVKYALDNLSKPTFQGLIKEDEENLAIRKENAKKKQISEKELGFEVDLSLKI